MSIVDRRNDFLRPDRAGVMFMYIPWCQTCRRHLEFWRGVRLDGCDINFHNCFADPDVLDFFTVDTYPCVYARQQNGRWSHLDQNFLERVLGNKVACERALRDLLG